MGIAITIGKTREGEISMSAFFCKEETIAYITMFIARAIREGDLSDPGSFRDYIKGRVHLDIPDLYNDLWLMNKEALEQRYDDISDMVPKYVSANNLTVEPLAYPGDIPKVCKMIDCYLYQCTEGVVDQSELYNAVYQAGRDLAYTYVRSLPTYDEQEWG